MRHVLTALAIASVGMMLPRTVAADESSGTWTGNAELRGNYFLERSTRVVMPAARVNVESPDGIRVRGSYVLDVISSASIAQTGGEVDAVFTEFRHGIGQLAVGKKVDTGSAELDLGVHGTYSTEDDYKSLTYGLGGSVALDEKNTTLSVGVTRVDDWIESNIDATFDGRFTGLTFGFGLQQLISPVMKFDLVYQLSYLEGFLGNPYRGALLNARARPGSSQLMGGIRQPEDPPDSRWRHNLEGQLSWYLPQTSTTLQLYLRGYTDDWDIQALTPEPRIYQQVGSDLVFRLRYRFYTQTRAEFAPADGQMSYPVGYEGPTTNDPKMERFRSHQIGLRIAYRLSFLDHSFLSFARDMVLDISLDRGFTTSRFQNYWIATAGARLPF